MSDDKKVIPIRKSPQQVADAFIEFEKGINDLIKTGYKMGLSPTHIVYVLQTQAHYVFKSIAKDSKDD